jgi:hypothetical protein
MDGGSSHSSGSGGVPHPMCLSRLTVQRPAGRGKEPNGSYGRELRCQVERRAQAQVRTPKPWLSRHPQAYPSLGPRQDTRWLARTGCCLRSHCKGYGNVTSCTLLWSVRQSGQAGLSSPPFAPAGELGAARVATMTRKRIPPVSCRGAQERPRTRVLPSGSGGPAQRLARRRAAVAGANPRAPAARCRAASAPGSRTTVRGAAEKVSENRSTSRPPAQQKPQKAGFEQKTASPPRGCPW